jgi:lipoprotein-releasing system permease protein
VYKLLLSWRYLRTRYLALASIISVMLGVATLIVVNSVMEGFATKLKSRLRGIQADVLIEARSMNDGMPYIQQKMDAVRQLLGDRVAGISPVIDGFAMFQFRMNRYGPTICRNVRVIGVDPATKNSVGEFAQHLQNPANKASPANCFNVEGPIAAAHANNYPRLPYYEPQPPKRPGNDFQQPPSPDPPELTVEEQKLFGAIVGYGMATYRNRDAKAGDTNNDVAMIERGDEITLIMVSRTDLEGHDGSRGYPKPIPATFVVTDLSKCDMSEFDSNIIYVDIKDMQKLRTMPDRATSLLIKLKDYDRDAKDVVNVLKSHFDPSYYIVETWEQKQGPILSAIGIERGILNVLLFLIIAVAGFGILAIFFMIVVEKTRDIGILKALGASNSGVMGIFLSYGLGLGIVGAGLGTVLGVSITKYINEIERLLAKITGQDVFPRDIYYFDKIPTDMQPIMVVLVVLGAVVIAVGASVLPSMRAALLRPVQALRYE